MSCLNCLNKVTFEVSAGKAEYDSDGNYERNYKFIELFDDFSLALAAYESCGGYHFRELRVGQLGHYTIIKE